MEIIKTSEDALAVLKKTRLQAPEALKTKGYNYTIFLILYKK